MGDILSTMGNIMINVGDILSTVGVFSAVGDIMSTVEGYHEYHGDILSTVWDTQYRGGTIFCYLSTQTVLNTPHSTEHSHGTEHTLYRVIIPK